MINLLALVSIIVYTQTGCGPCEETKAYLHQHHIPFHECNVSNPDCLQQFEARGGTGTPLIIIGNKKIEGFDANAIQEALQNVAKKQK